VRPQVTTMRITGITLFFVLLISSNALPLRKSVRAQGEQEKWKQIVVLRSSRSDVERLLGESKYKGYDVAYDLEDGHLDIAYAIFNFCEKRNKFGWKVPEWTVTEVNYSPYRAPQFSSLKLNLKGFRKIRENPCCPEMITYVSQEQGIGYTLNPEGTLNNIRYFPSSRYDYLLCSKQSKKMPRRNGVSTWTAL
jgi:hypothetical protein